MKIRIEKRYLVNMYYLFWGTMMGASLEGNIIKAISTGIIATMIWVVVDLIYSIVRKEDGKVGIRW